ncbi:fimbrillin family protein [Sphingobacterium sp. LRF_L2]|uniref:fimbrillin family protein n=1 Tax=Sphingobacterium sp. LRF_L2 TaxID=3369421 RepID=UPI003F5D977E
MKVNKLLLATAVSAIALASSCQKAPLPESEMTSAVTFSSKIANQVTTKASNNAWESNDAIGVFMKTGTGLSNVLASNKQYVTPNTSGNFTAASTSEEILYPTDGSTVDFIAYYPYQATVSNNSLSVNLADQSTQNKIDLLYSANATGLSKSNTNAQLEFSHVLSKVELTVAAGSGVSSLSGLAVQFDGLNTTADFALASGSLSNVANKTAFNAKMTAGTSTTVAEAIVLPATAISGAKVVFQLSGATYTWEMPSTATFEAGKKYQYSIQLSNDASGQTAAVVSSTIVNWTDVPSGSYTIIKDEDGGTTEPTDPTGETVTIYEEDFGTLTFSSNPKIAAYTGWSNSSVTYTDQFGAADIRKTSTSTNHVWLPANKDAELSIAGINTAGASQLSLKFQIAANVFNTGTTFDVSNLKIVLNGQEFTPTSKVLSRDNNDANIFYEIELDLSAATSVPASSTLVFSTTTATNTVGVRLDDIVLSGTK